MTLCLSTCSYVFHVVYRSGLTINPDCLCHDDNSDCSYYNYRCDYVCTTTIHFSCVNRCQLVIYTSRLTVSVGCAELSFSFYLCIQPLASLHNRITRNENTTLQRLHLIHPINETKQQKNNVNTVICKFYIIRLFLDEFDLKIFLLILL